jgi:hypothetical protein
MSAIGRQRFPAISSDESRSLLARMVLISANSAPADTARPEAAEILTSAAEESPQRNAIVTQRWDVT